MKPSTRALHIDIETYCDVDIKKTGMYAYVFHPSFSIILFSYAYDDGPTICIDLLQGEEIPQKVISDLSNPNITKAAHNALFEFTALETFLFEELDYTQWVCTMIMAYQQGLPGSLDAVGSVLKLKKQKLSTGKSLINYFCKPCKPSAANGYRTRNLPEHDIDKWEAFKEYNIRDVETEQIIYEKLLRFSQPEFERELFQADYRINRRGIRIDHEFVESAIHLDQIITEEHMERLKEITGLDNPKSAPQFKQYLKAMGYDCPSFTKTIAGGLLQTLDPVVDAEVIEAIELKLLVSKSSTAKYEAMQRAWGSDFRVRGVFQYYGAGRTGRWAGRLIQPQNFPQNHLDDLDYAKELVTKRDADSVRMFYDDVPNTLSQLIRTALIPSEGKRFIVADYSAIEARVIAWLAGEKWRQDVFASGGDIYCASASAMFKIPVEKHGVNGHLRQKGKIAELALGYQGGVGAMIQMGALRMGLDESELQPIVTKWRKASPKIVKLWNDCQDAAINVIENNSIDKSVPRLVFAKQHGHLLIRLPSGRKLIYRDVQVKSTDKGPNITYMGQNQTSKKWERLSTFGGKLVENITQAVARDCLAIALVKLDREGYEIVGHVHDEVIIEVTPEITIEEITDIMGEPIDWADGLILTAEGYDCISYRKD